MEQKNIDTELFFWEIPEVELRYRRYGDTPSDVIKKVKYDIEYFLTTPNLDEERSATITDENGNKRVVNYNIREVYSAIYNALNYYKNASYHPSAEYKTGDTFIENSINAFNDDYTYLANKYNSKNPLDHDVISRTESSGRIKAPLSFFNKVREKVTEYILEGRDFSYFNESLRDLVGMRFVIDPPKEIQEQGLQAESDFLYKVYYDLMEHHGITLPQDTPLEKGLFKFIPVNTRHDPHKLEKIKSRPEKEGFSECTQNLYGFTFFVPEHRIPEVEQECVDSVTKDYNKFAKFKGYQSIHTCVVPYYSQDVEPIPLPNCIIPPKSNDYCIEYQFRTAKQHQYSKYGPASHDTEYKPATSYHRGAVPYCIEFDSLQDIEEDYYENSRKQKPLNYQNKLKLRNFGESFRRFYKTSFKDFFGITYKNFRDIFGSSDRNDILSRRKVIYYDKERDLYVAQDARPSGQNNLVLAMTPQELVGMQEALAKKDVSIFNELLKNTHFQDSIIKFLQDPETQKMFTMHVSTHYNLKVITLDSPGEEPQKNASQNQYTQENQNVITSQQTNTHKRVPVSLDDDL